MIHSIISEDGRWGVVRDNLRGPQGAMGGNEEDCLSRHSCDTTMQEIEGLPPPLLCFLHDHSSSVLLISVYIIFCD